jgi:MerR family transcriptional regulator, copper efflux regulator
MGALVGSNAMTMTIGQLSRRTSVPIKQLREYEGLGFIYTLGRSAGNYRLFGEEALWCVRVVQGLRALGLTLKEIQTLVAHYGAHPHESLGARLDEQLARADARVAARIADLQALRRRIHAFQATYREGTAMSPELARLLASDPRRCALAAVNANAVP